MKFQVNYVVGTETRSKNIIADSLDEAVKLADKVSTKWVDVFMLNPKLEPRGIIDRPTPKA